MSKYRYRVVDKHIKFQYSAFLVRRVFFASGYKQRKLIKTNRLFNLDKRRF